MLPPQSGLTCGIGCDPARLLGRGSSDLASLPGLVTIPLLYGAQVNKSELAEALATKTGLSSRQAADAVNAIFSTDGIIISTLQGGGEVNVTGFGAFKVTTRAARVATNPATGGKINVPAKKAPKFSAGKSLKDAIA